MAIFGKLRVLLRFGFLALKVPLYKIIRFLGGKVLKPYRRCMEPLVQIQGRLTLAIQALDIFTIWAEMPKGVCKGYGISIKGNLGIRRGYEKTIEQVSLAVWYFFIIKEPEAFLAHRLVFLSLRGKRLKADDGKDGIVAEGMAAQGKRVRNLSRACLGGAFADGMNTYALMADNSFFHKILFAKSMEIP